MSETRKVISIDDTNREKVFEEAYDGSYYTVTGCGGNIGEWIEGYIKGLTKVGIGVPGKFITFKGRDMNAYYGLTGENAYQEELTFMMFPLDGLLVDKLALFKLKWKDRWFDDIVDNNRRREEEKQG